MYDRSLRVLRYKLDAGVSDKVNEELAMLASGSDEDFIQIVGVSTYVDVMKSEAPAMLVLVIEVHTWDTPDRGDEEDFDVAVQELVLTGDAAHDVEAIDAMLERFLGDIGPDEVV